MRTQKYRLHHDALADTGAGGVSDSAANYASNYLLLRPNYSSASASSAVLNGPSSSNTNTSDGTPVPVGSNPSSPVAGPSSSSAGTGGLMLENVSPVGNRSGSSSSNSQHLMVQQHQHHFQQQQQQSNEDIKRDLSDMCGQQSAGQQESMQTDHEADDSDLHHQHHQQQQQQQQHKETQYISANCVVFMSYSGDTASVVDQHFSRALNSTQPESGGGGGGGGSSGSPYADASSASSVSNSQKTSSGIPSVKSKSPP